MSDLSGKKALVTGAGMGIGQGIAVELARRGAEVAVHYAPTEPEETVSQIEKLGAKAATVQGDLSKVADCERTVDTAAEALGRLDTLVNNAGVTKTLDFLDTDEETYDSVFDLNNRKVRVNAVGPGIIEVPRYFDIPNYTTEFGNTLVPWGRGSHPEDVAPAVAFFVSDAADFVQDRSST